MTITTSALVGSLLTDDMLAKFDERAPAYDRENRFFTEDFDDLRASGYLLAAVPTQFGGFGLSLAELAPLQRRLAYHAPATAVAVNMHLYWTGAAADLLRHGDDSLAWVLEAAADGHVFAAGHGERGNDIPLLLSTSEAERVDGGWHITGHKIFGSLSPVWTFMGVHAMDTSDPSAPQIVHAFVSRDAPGVKVIETWDTIGMRATSSHDTILDNVFVPDSHVALVTPAGFAGAGLFHLGVFAWGMLGFGAVYLGIADRAFDLTVAGACQKTSIALTRSMAHHPGVQFGVADMRIKLEAAGAHLDRTCADWSSGADHGAEWPLKLIATKHNVVNRAWEVVDTAMELTGGSGIFRGNRMEQLFRDARLGRIHPGNREPARGVRPVDGTRRHRRCAGVGASLRWAPFNAGHLYSEARSWIERALAAAAGADVDELVLARGLVSAGAVAGLESRPADAVALLEEAMALLTVLGADDEIVWCRMWLGAFSADASDFAAAVEHTRVGLALAQRLGSTTSAVYLANQHAENAIAAHAFLADGDHLTEARRSLDLALAGSEHEHIEEGLVRAQNGSAIVDARSDPEASLAACRTALDGWRRLGSGARLIMSLTSAARVAILAGDHAASASMLSEAVDVMAAVGWRQPLGRIIEAASLNAMEQGDHATAAMLRGAAAGRFMTPRWYVDLTERLERSHRAARLGDPDGWDAHVTRGGALTDDDVFDIVRSLAVAVD